MSVRVQLVSIFIGVAMFLVIMHLVRRKKLREEASLLWLAAGILMVLIPVWKEGFFAFSEFLGVGNAASALFLLGFIFVLLVLLHLSVIISRLTEDNREFAQAICLLREELERAEGLSPGPPAFPGPSPSSGSGGSAPGGSVAGPVGPAGRGA